MATGNQLLFIELRLFSHVCYYSKHTISGAPAERYSHNYTARIQYGTGVGSYINVAYLFSCPLVY